MQDEKKKFSDHLLILTKYRKIIIINFLIVTFLSAGISFLMPKWYLVSTSILPPESDSFNFGMLSSLMSYIPGGSGMELPLMATPSDVFASILKSRSVLEIIIKNNDLYKVYKVDKFEDVQEILLQHLTIKVGDEGIVHLSIEDKRKERALKMANEFIEQLDMINREKRKSKGRSTREFIEERLNKNKSELSDAEEKLKVFQKKNGIIEIEQQTQAMINISAQMMAELKMKELEYNVLSKSLEKTHPKVQLLEQNIDEIKNQIQKIESGYQDENKRLDSQILGIPISSMPDLGLEYLRLYREVKIQELIYEFILQQYEQAKIQEKRDTPTIQVLDAPKLPEKKFKPQRKLIVTVSSFLSLFFTISTIFIIEYFNRLKITSPTEYSKYTYMISSIKSDYKHIFKR